MRMGPYLSCAPMRVHRVIRKGPSGHIGNIGQSSVRSKNIKFGTKWVENRPFGLKQRPNKSYRLSGPIRTTPKAQNDQKSDFLREMAPGGPRRPPSLLSAQAGAYVVVLAGHDSMELRRSTHAHTFLPNAELSISIDPEFECTDPLNSAASCWPRRGHA